jgi:hypothetical protein
MVVSELYRAPTPPSRPPFPPSHYPAFFSSSFFLNCQIILIVTRYLIFWISSVFFLIFFLAFFLFSFLFVCVSWTTEHLRRFRRHLRILDLRIHRIYHRYQKRLDRQVHLFMSNAQGSILPSNSGAFGMISSIVAIYLFPSSHNTIASSPFLIFSFFFFLLFCFSFSFYFNKKS